MVGDNGPCKSVEQLEMNKKVPYSLLLFAVIINLFNYQKIEE